MQLPIQAPPVMRQRGIPVAMLHRGIFPQDKCSTCKSILAGVIETAAKGSCWLGCKGVGIAVGAACDLAFGGPEDPVGDVVCPVAGTAVGTICNQFGCSALKTKSGAEKAAAEICSKVSLC